MRGQFSVKIHGFSQRLDIWPHRGQVSVTKFHKKGQFLLTIYTRLSLRSSNTPSPGFLHTGRPAGVTGLLAKRAISQKLFAQRPKTTAHTPPENGINAPWFALPTCPPHALSPNAQSRHVPMGQGLALAASGF